MNKNTAKKAQIITDQKEEDRFDFIDFIHD